jgi:hypothetical protein
MVNQGIIREGHYGAAAEQGSARTSHRTMSTSPAFSSRAASPTRALFRPATRTPPPSASSSPASATTSIPTTDFSNETAIEVNYKAQLTPLALPPAGLPGLLKSRRPELARNNLPARRPRKRGIMTVLIALEFNHTLQYVVSGAEHHSDENRPAHFPFGSCAQVHHPGSQRDDTK